MTPLKFSIIMLIIVSFIYVGIFLFNWHSSTSTEDYLIKWSSSTKSENCTVGQLFYDMEDLKKPQAWLCCEPGVWKIIKENHEWSDNETETVVGIVKGIDTTEINP